MCVMSVNVDEGESEVSGIVRRCSILLRYVVKLVACGELEACGAYKTAVAYVASRGSFSLNSASATTQIQRQLVRVLCFS